MMTKTKFKSTLTALGVGLAFASAPAAAAVTFFTPTTTLEDDNLDFIVDSGVGNVGTTGVGDRLIAVLKFNQTTGILAGQGPSGILPQELTAVSDITAIAVGLNGRLIFAASNSPAAMAVNGGNSGVLSAFAVGTTAALWLDNTPDTNVINAACGTRAACIASAGLGGGDPGSSLWATIGFFGDADNLWISGENANGQSIATIQGGAAASNFQSFNYSQQIGINNTGSLFGQRSCGL